MTEKYYSIAGRTVKLIMEKDEPPRMFENFELGYAVLPDVIVEIWQQRRRFHIWYGVDYYYMDEQYPHLFVSRRFPKVRLMSDRDWKHFIVEGAEYGQDGVMEAFLCAFYSRLSMNGGILVHASCAALGGEGIIFTAASGTGKTTQAELWNRYKGAEILNGDKVILECRDEKYISWGSPWKGSSPYALNKNVLLKAIIVIEQGKKNKICRLESENAVAAFFPHVFYPSWNEECTGKVMDSLAGVLQKVPVYFLSCLPDQAAVELTYRTIWGENIR